ncbi:MAG: hypothetical protein WC670_19340 [Pseudolabrys sp.]|jgi:hypothetical protein
MITDISPGVESDLLQKVEVLAFYLQAIGRESPEAAKRLKAEMVRRLEASMVRIADGRDASAEITEKRVALRPVLVTSQPLPRDNTEEFILASLASTPNGLSVQELVERLDEARIEIRRQTLVVRLHRMVRAEKLVVKSHGHYALNNAFGMRLTQSG